MLEAGGQWDRPPGIGPEASQVGRDCSATHEYLPRAYAHSKPLIL